MIAGVLKEQPEKNSFLVPDIVTVRKTGSNGLDRTDAGTRRLILDESYVQAVVSKALSGEIRNRQILSSAFRSPMNRPGSPFRRR